MEGILLSELSMGKYWRCSYVKLSRKELRFDKRCIYW